MEGRSLENPHPAITMFALCDNMKWNHLPVAGGIYDQDPNLMTKFRLIFDARNKHQAEEMKRQEKESQRKRGSSRKPARRR